MNVIQKLFAGGAAPVVTGGAAPVVTGTTVRPHRRIYEVTNFIGQPARLVRARSRTHAIDFVVGSMFIAEIPNVDRLISLVSDGTKVEEAPDPK